MIALYQQTGFGKKRLSKLIPEVGSSTIRKWIANFVSENPQAAVVVPENRTTCLVGNVSKSVYGNMHP